MSNVIAKIKNACGKANMILGIDAFNIRGGGCLTHLTEILQVIDPLAHGFSKVVIWGNSHTLEKIQDRRWLVKIYVPLLDSILPCRLFWHRFMAKKLAQDALCDLVFVPGGSESNKYHPVVTMSQNMLPFEWNEIFRYRSPTAILRLLLIRWVQTCSFREADGIIFLTNYARDSILKITGKVKGDCVIIPHGVNTSFYRKPRLQSPDAGKGSADPWRILYVSALYIYKHQWNVVEAVALLRNGGIPIVLELVGPSGDASGLLKQIIDRVDPKREFIVYHGAVAHQQLNNYYLNADIGIFASSCENMPNILIEKMAAGLPIACSKMGPMPEVLGGGGIYFDPCDYLDIASAIQKLITSSELRAGCAKTAFHRAQQLSWQRCADDTFAFLAHIAKRSKKRA